MSKVVYLPVKLISYLKEGALEDEWNSEWDWCDLRSGIVDESRAPYEEVCDGLGCNSCVADAGIRLDITNGSKAWRLKMYITEKRGS